MMMHAVDPSTESMSQATVAQLLGEMIPFLHGLGQHHFVEAVTEAIDLVAWRPLSIADRSGATGLVAFGPSRFKPGYVASARWMREVTEWGLEANEVALADRCVARAGGWWGSGHRGRPHTRPAFGWRPWPTFDGTEPVRFEPMAVAA